mgnify:CR=1 FL=1
MFFTGITFKIYAQITGFVLFVWGLDISKICYVSVKLITGLTTLYKFVKEIRVENKKKTSARKKKTKVKKLN